MRKPAFPTPESAMLALNALDQYGTQIDVATLRCCPATINLGAMEDSSRGESMEVNV
jgi:hypothetical protein